MKTRRSAQGISRGCYLGGRQRQSPILKWYVSNTVMYLLDIVYGSTYRCYMYSSNSTVSIHWLCTSQSVIILVDESVGYQDHIQQWGRTTISLPPSSSGRPLRDVRSRRLRRTHPCGPISNRDGLVLVKHHVHHSGRARVHDAVWRDIEILHLPRPRLL